MRLCALLLLILALSACDEKILHGLDELQANQVKVALAKHDIRGEKVREGGAWSVTVNADVATEALTILEESRVLKRDLMRSANESKSLIQSKEERKQNYERQLSWSLEQTLESLPGVLEARVHLYYEELPTLNVSEQEGRQSASVLLVTSRDITESSVKRLVAGASGIPHQAISVVRADQLASAPAGKEEVSKLGVSFESQRTVSTVSAGSDIGQRRHRSLYSKAPWEQIEYQLAFCALVVVLLLAIYRRRQSSKAHSEDETASHLSGNPQEKEVAAAWEIQHPEEHHCAPPLSNPREESLRAYKQAEVF